MESAAPNVTTNATDATIAPDAAIAWLHTTVAAVASSARPSDGGDRFSSISAVVMFVLFCGFVLNVLALYVLYRTRSSSNQKHGFMLRCMVTNDAIAVFGMLALKAVTVLWYPVKRNLWYCRVLVLMRFFGLGSGCVALVMAIERWLALTKPFFYQKHISLRLLKRSVISLWLIVLCLVCAPFIGIGLYWDAENSMCKRYRDAKKPCDVMYAYAYFSFGVFLCVAIAATNLAVMKALCMKNGLYNKHNVLMRRVSRGSSLTCNAATKEERTFGWLMLILCVFFVMFWIPQMVLVPLSLHTSKNDTALTRMGDLLLTAHFVLDPCAYVLHHWTLVKSVFRQRRSTTRANGGGSASVSRSSSMRTTYEVYSQQP